MSHTVTTWQAQPGATSTGTALCWCHQSQGKQWQHRLPNIHKYNPSGLLTLQRATPQLHQYHAMPQQKGHRPRILKYILGFLSVCLPESTIIYGSSPRTCHPCLALSIAINWSGKPLLRIPPGSKTIEPPNDRTEVKDHQ